MWTDSQTRALAEHLDRLSQAETRSWLLDALHGRQSLPLLASDELFYIGVLRLEPLLSKETRRDLASACVRLVYEFIRAGQADPEYLNSLLRLVVHFGLDELAAPLAILAPEQQPERSDLRNHSSRCWRYMYPSPARCYRWLQMMVSLAP